MQRSQIMNGVKKTVFFLLKHFYFVYDEDFMQPLTSVFSLDSFLGVFYCLVISNSSALEHEDVVKMYPF